MVKRYVTLIILLLLVNFSYCQIEDKSNSVHFQCNDVIPFWDPEELPIYDRNLQTNDMKKLYEFVKENIQYPETAKADKVEGYVLVQFWIDTTGASTEHRVIQSIRQDFDNEALHVAKLIKFDVPAKDRGKSVGMCFQIPVSFSLDKDSKLNSNNVKKSKKSMSQ